MESNMKILKKILTTCICRTVKWFIAVHEYSFIKHMNKKDIFVHYTTFTRNPFTFLHSVGDGETMELHVMKGAKGAEAANFSPVKGKLICTL